jgi:hypothetical protein
MGSLFIERKPGMATPLQKSITRELQYDATTYKVVVSPDGVRVTRKGTRRGVELSWDDILAFDGGSKVAESQSAVSSEGRMPKLGMQEVVAADVILLLRCATETLSDASSLIDSASELPGLLAAHREPPQPREEERSDWYIEPLLTIRQVSKLLGVSTRRVRNLPLKAIDLDGETRYHPADLRRFLTSRLVTTPGKGYRR